MSHSYDRSHGHSRPYLEELCTICVTVLLGLVAVSLGSNENRYILWSGLTILGLAACRSIFLVFSIANHGNHRREPAAIPWRCFLLIFPVMLFFFGPPVTSAKPNHARSVQGQNVIHMTWDDLHAWAQDEQKREWSEGRIGVVQGHLLGNKAGHTFILEKYFDEKIFRVTVLSDQEILDVHLGRVEVTGQIHYRKEGTVIYDGDREEEVYNVILKVRSRDDIVPIAIDEPWP